MGREIQEFRAAVGGWLVGISDLADVVGDKIFAGIPNSRPGDTFVRFGTARERGTAYSMHSWEGNTTLYLYAPKQDTLDTMENAITEDISDDTLQVLKDRLSTGTLNVTRFDFADVGEDQPTFDPNDESFLALERAVRFTIAFSESDA